jgi:hypothetical protein
VAHWQLSIGLARANRVKLRARHLGKGIAWANVMRAAVLSVALTACAYSPGSFRHFRHDFPGQRTTVGCLDLAIERRPDLTTGGTVLAYEFGNRCDHPAVVDLASVEVVGRTVGGDEVKLAPYDPEREMRALAIDGRAAGQEAIAYPSMVALAEVCVNAATVTHQGSPSWLCFGDRWLPQAPAIAKAEVTR